MLSKLTRNLECSFTAGLSRFNPFCCAETLFLREQRRCDQYVIITAAQSFQDVLAKGRDDLAQLA